ncbi:hypothetical protein [Planomonospora alba]|uniref:hypothetical protein n=1 Tax=Planomonospora alba TaxID=161354 RepID=UPI0031E4F7FD
MAPATYNTIGEFARGIADTYAPGLLAEAPGLGIPRDGPALRQHRSHRPRPVPPQRRTTPCRRCARPSRSRSIRAPRPRLRGRQHRRLPLASGFEQPQEPRTERPRISRQGFKEEDPSGGRPRPQDQEPPRAQ